MLIHQVARKGSVYKNKNWVYRSLQSVLVPDQQWISNFYCSSCIMIKQIYTRWLWLFTAMYSEAWAEGKAPPGRNICMPTTCDILCASSTSRMYRDASRQNCELVLCNGVAHLQRTHTGFPHGLWYCWNYYSSFFLLQVLLLQQGYKNTKNPWKSLKSTNSGQKKRHSWRTWM